ncbi:hypothetical protein SAMN05216230_102633 [Pseudomonas soli]|uniref:Uncharacterized protein n=1 Tax=Pseudomonas soli TaxID=1306993 RepID=A0A1H9FTN7_9PSED|nr:hypothetical protein SAMN05216230_102633 [Pseudomonas soli]
MYTHADNAVMIDTGSAVDHRIGTNLDTRLHNRTGHYLDTFIQFHVGRHPCRRMDKRGKTKTSRPQRMEDIGTTRRTYHLAHAIDQTDRRGIQVIERFVSTQYRDALPVRDLARQLRVGHAEDLETQRAK